MVTPGESPIRSYDRREVLVEVMVELVARHGLDRLSVREVARAAGVSIGTVQHHFASKQAMLVAAMAGVTEGFRARLASVSWSDDPAETITQLALALLPLDEDGRTGSLVWLAFLARAAVDPELATLHTRSWQELESSVAGLFRRHRGHGRVTAADRTDAALLLATLDGLAATAVVERNRLAPERVRRLVRRQLELLLD